MAIEMYAETQLQHRCGYTLHVKIAQSICKLIITSEQMFFSFWLKSNHQELQKEYKQWTEKHRPATLNGVLNEGKLGLLRILLHTTLIHFQLI